MSTLVMVALVVTAPATTGLSPSVGGGFSYGFTSYHKIPKDSLAAPVAKKLVALAARAAAAGVHPDLLTNSIAVPILTPVSVTMQHHSQDGLGQYRFGYTSAYSARSETRARDGTVRGWYSFQDAHGIPQKVDYIADGNGFRAAFTSLPTEPVA